MVFQPQYGSKDPKVQTNRFDGVGVPKFDSCLRLVAFSATNRAP